MANKTETTTTSPSGGVADSNSEVRRRLQEAFPEVSTEGMDERFKALGGAHNLTEKWDRIVREISEFVDLLKSVQ